MDRLGVRRRLCFIREKELFVSSDLPEPPRSAFREGPARCLYRFVAAIELSPSVAVHSQDRQDIVRFWNRACAELLGIPASEAIGQPFVKLVKHIGKQQEFDDNPIWRPNSPTSKSPKKPS